jgi:hypothetical protein
MFGKRREEILKTLQVNGRIACACLLPKLIELYLQVFLERVRTAG